MADDAAEDRRQAEAAALGRLAGREEGIEDVLHDRRRDAGAAVADAQLEVAAVRVGRAGGSDQPLLPGRLALDPVDRDAHRLAGLAEAVEPAQVADRPPVHLERAGAALQSLGGVEQELPQHAGEGLRLGLDGELAAAAPDAQGRAGRQDGPRRRSGLLDRRRERDDLTLAAARPGEGQGIVDQLLGPLGRDHDLLGEAVLRAVLGEVLGQEARVADDRGQHVVEVVGHVAGQPAQRVQALAARLGAADPVGLLGELERLRADQPDQAAAPRGGERQDHRPRQAVEAAQRDPAAPVAVAQDRRQGLALDPAPRVLDEQRRPVPADQPVVVRLAELPAQRGVGEGDPPELVAEEQALAQALQTGGESALVGRSGSGIVAFLDMGIRLQGHRLDLHLNGETARACTLPLWLSSARRSTARKKAPAPGRRRSVKEGLSCSGTARRCR